MQGKKNYEYFQYGFTCSENKPECVLCCETLAADIIITAKFARFPIFVI